MKICAKFAEIEIKKMGNSIQKLRMIKSEDEIKIIKKATEIADIAFQEIQKDIKLLTAEAKLDGVPTGMVKKVLNKIKKDMKQTEEDKTEEDLWYDKLKVTSITDKIGVLIATDE
jgi:uncharacterized protein (UPF0335 family)